MDASYRFTTSYIFPKPSCLALKFRLKLMWCCMKERKVGGHTFGVLSRNFVQLLQSVQRCNGALASFCIDHDMVTKTTKKDDCE